METKLRPVLQAWLHELGPKQFAAQLLQLPHMLRRTPQEVQELRLWLLSLGIADTDTAVRQNPVLLKQQLQRLQQNMKALRTYALPGLVQLAICHPAALTYRPQHLYEVYTTMAEIIDADPASSEVADLMGTKSSTRPFQIRAEDLKARASAFCQSFAADHATVQKALKRGVFSCEPATVQQRAELLKQLLSLKDAELKKLLKQPMLLTMATETLHTHLTSYYALGFTQADIKAMCLAQPTLLLLDMTSEINREKWAFLTGILQLSTSEVAAAPVNLTRSLMNVLGPRHAFVVHLTVSGVMGDRACIAVRSLITSTQNDAGFAKLLSRRIKTSSLEYTASFKAQWHVFEAAARYQH